MREGATSGTYYQYKIQVQNLYKNKYYFDEIIIQIKHIDVNSFAEAQAVNELSRHKTTLSICSHHQVVCVSPCSLIILQ